MWRMRVSGGSSGRGRVEPAGVRWLTPGPWRYSCELTVDTNTVNRNLKLSDNNRKVTRVEEYQPYPDHPERFDSWYQLLCRDGLTGRCYWEVETRGDVYISVSYRGISRRGDSYDCWFGYNDQSWSLFCSDDRYSVCHNKRVTSISSSSVSNRVTSISSSSVSNRVASISSSSVSKRVASISSSSVSNRVASIFSSSSVSGRVAVYVDCPAGSLSFYTVSSDSLILLHTFNTTFTQPLYPGFGFWSPGSSVSLSPV
ncbi:stonustoxin subunit alpha-like [Sander vitreus]